MNDAMPGYQALALAIRVAIKNAVQSGDRSTAMALTSILGSMAKGSNHLERNSEERVGPEAAD
jgi:hypothetical protein